MALASWNAASPYPHCGQTHLLWSLILSQGNSHRESTWPCTLGNSVSVHASRAWRPFLHLSITDVAVLCSGPFWIRNLELEALLRLQAGRAAWRGNESWGNSKSPPQVLDGRWGETGLFSTPLSCPVVHQLWRGAEGESLPRRAGVWAASGAETGEGTLPWVCHPLLAFIQNGDVSRGQSMSVSATDWVTCLPHRAGRKWKIPSRPWW